MAEHAKQPADPAAPPDRPIDPKDEPNHVARLWFLVTVGSVVAYVAAVVVSIFI